MKICGQKSSAFWRWLSWWSVFGMITIGIFASYTNSAKAAISASDINYYFPLDTRVWDGASRWNYYDYATTTRIFKATSATATTTGKFADGVLTTGNNDGSYAENTSASWARNTSGEFSYSFWLKTAATTGNLQFFSVDTDQLIRLEIRNGTTINFTSAKSGGGYCDHDFASAFNNDNNWHNVIVQGTWGSVETDFKIYLDGTQVASTLPAGCNNSPAGTGVSAVWGYGRGATENLSFDDIAFFNRKLTTGEIGDIQTNSIATLLAPSITGQIYWAGVGKQYGQIGGSWEVPFYWNLCADYNSITSAWADIVIGGDILTTQVIQDKTSFIGPQACQGYGTLRGNITATTTRTDAATLYLEDDPVSGVVYASTTIDYVIGSAPFDTTNYISLIDQSPIYIPPTAATSTQIRFSYDFTGLGYSGGQVCLYNLDANVVTNYCNSITSAAGASAITIPNATSDFYLDASFKMYDSGGVVISQSNPFMIVWYSNSQSYKVSQSLGTTTAGFVCTPDEWATPDPELDIAGVGVPMPALNFTKMKCSILTSLTNLAEAIASAPKNAALGMIEAIKLIFPFNLPTQIIKSWNESATATIPSNLDWLNLGDSEGNISLTMPAALFGATSTIPVWGPQLAGGNTALLAIFAGIKALSVYLMAALFFTGLYFTGKMIVNKSHQAGQ